MLQLTGECLGGAIFSLRPLCLRTDIENRKPGETMAIAASALSSKSIGLYVQIAGAGAFGAGAVLSLHHFVTGICLIAGAAAFFIGKKLRAA